MFSCCYSSHELIQSVNSKNEAQISLGRAVVALVGALPGVPAPVLLEVGGVPELPAAVSAGEARLVGVDEQVVVEGVLPREHGGADGAHEGANACNKW